VFVAVVIAAWELKEAVAEDRVGAAVGWWFGLMVAVAAMVLVHELRV